MPRQKRNVKPGQDIHTIFRSIDNSFLFEGRLEQNILLRTLNRIVERYRAPVYAWVGMSNHHHIFNQAPTQWPEDHPFAERGVPISVGHMFRDCFSLFARWLNTKRRRVGGVIRDRTKTVLVKSPAQSITLLIYIFLNPVRAGIVRHPRDYPFHNFHMYAYGQKKFPGIFTYHPAYLKLGKTPGERQHRFRVLVNAAIQTWAKKRWVGFSASHGPGRNLKQINYGVFESLANSFVQFISLTRAPPKGVSGLLQI